MAESDAADSRATLTMPESDAAAAGTPRGWLAFGPADLPDPAGDGVSQPVPERFGGNYRVTEGAGNLMMGGRVPASGARPP